MDPTHVHLWPGHLETPVLSGDIAGVVCVTASRSCRWRERRKQPSSIASTPSPADLGEGLSRSSRSSPRVLVSRLVALSRSWHRRHCGQRAWDDRHSSSRCRSVVHVPRRRRHPRLELTTAAVAAGKGGGERGKRNELPKIRGVNARGSEVHSQQNQVTKGSPFPNTTLLELHRKRTRCQCIYIIHCSRLWITQNQGCREYSSTRVINYSSNFLLLEYSLLSIFG